MTLLAWPGLEENAWIEAQQADVHSCFTAFANTILLYQNLLIICQNQKHLNFIQERIQTEQHTVSYFICDSDDIWIRDYGPISVYSNDSIVWNDFTFNAWGGKFPATKDNLITSRLQLSMFDRIKRISYLNVLEGGALETDGQGILLTTAQCVLDPVRNPGISEKKFREFALNSLGCDEVHILRNGHLEGDDTDGHIDTLARFSSVDSIVYQGCSNPDDRHFIPLQKMRHELESLRTRNNKAYRLYALPMPEAIYARNGQRLPASYANFLIINNAVLYPRYNVPQDDQAESVLQSAFPARKIHGIDCAVLIEQFGSLHCASMQIPFHETAILA